MGHIDNQPSVFSIIRKHAYNVFYMTSRGYVSMRVLRLSFSILLSIVALLGVSYVIYSGWYSVRLFTEGASAFIRDNTAECIEGVPVASAAGIDTEDHTFQWVWAPLPRFGILQSFRTIPAADEIIRRLPNQPARNQVVIQFVDGTKSAERRAYLELINGEIERSLSRIDTYVVTISGEIPDPFPPSPYVVKIERDYYAGVTTTNDAYYDDQWAIPYLGIEAIWATLPENTEPIVVAVIDSGVCLDHPDLEGKIGFGWDFVEDDNSPQDEMGHGCGVAGTIAANVNNQIGIAGVASPIVEIMPLRVLDKKGIGTQSNIAAAIMFAADRKADIINLSLAGPNPSTALQDAITYANGKGSIIIAAAGNNGSEGAWYPAAYDHVLAVGSIDISNERSSFSNFGTNVDIYAPGRDIYTTSRTGEYETMTGTSFAAPLVSGLTALDIAINGRDVVESNEIQAPIRTENCP